MDGEWHTFSLKLSVPQRDQTGSIRTSNILVILFYIYDSTVFVPFEVVGSGLVLDANVVTHN